MLHYIAEQIITSQYKKTKLINYRQQRDNTNTLETCTFIVCNQYRMNYDGHIDITRQRCSLGIQYKHESKEHIAGFISKPVARPEYGMIYQHKGMLLQNLHRRYLYITIKLPHLSDLEQRIPNFPNCNNYGSLHPSNPDPLLDETPTNDNELHQVICNTFKIDYLQEMDIIIKIQNRLEHKINYTLPVLLPNKMQQGTVTSGEGKRNKRVIPTLAIIQGVAAMGRMMIKGINALVDAKRASSFNNAIKSINVNIQIAHDRLITLENRTAMMAKAIIPVLKDFKQQINNTNDRLYRQYQMMMRAHDRYNRLFRQTHKTFQIHHLALLMIKDYITILLGTLQRIHRQYVRYKSALDDTLIGIEQLNSGYLTHRILEPRMLAQYLEDDLEETAPAFEPVFTNVYQYYGNSLISFTNIIDDLLLQLPILIKLKVQVPMSLFSIETAPVPLDAETYLGEKREYTQIIPETELIALTENNYIPLTQAQISLCAKIGYMYYCEYAHLLKKCTEHTCMSAIYYDQGSDIKANQCKMIVTFDTILESKILDADDLLILSNLQKPWTIVRKDISRVFKIEYSTYRILDRSELCECSLIAGNYLLSYMNINCGNIPEARDGYFTTFYSFNKKIMDVITEKFDIQVDENTRNQATLLHDDIPGYDLPTMDFVNTTTDLDEDVFILEEDNSQIYAYLNNVLVHMIDKQQTAIFKLNQDFNKNKEKISQYIKYAEIWQVASVICSYMEMACDTLLIIAMIVFLLKYQKTMQAMLTAFLQINTKNSAIQSVQADQIGRTYPPLLMINLLKEEEIIDDLREITMMEYVVQIIMIIVCIAIVIIIMYFSCTKCRHTCTIFKYCFPFLPISRIVRTLRCTDLFVEVTNITKGNGIWAHFVSTGCFPTQIQLSRPIQKDDVQIETVCCIFKQIRINWSSINVTGISGTIINMPDTAFVSIFTDNDLTHIMDDHFEIKLIARLLDQMYVIPAPVFPLRYDDAPPQHLNFQNIYILYLPTHKQKV